MDKFKKANKYKKELEKVKTNVPDIVRITADYKSVSYELRIRSLGFSAIHTKAIIKGIRRIFNNKKSESREGFYAVNLKNTKQHFYNGNGNKQSVKRPKKLSEFIKKNMDADIIVIHNHRGNTIPSVSDLYMVSQYKCSHRGLVIGNGGVIYYYESRRMINSRIFKEYYLNEEKCQTVEERKKLFLTFCSTNDIIFIEK